MVSLEYAEELCEELEFVLNEIADLVEDAMDQENEEALIADDY